MRKLDVKAPRPDGRLTTYRVYPDMTPPLTVDRARVLKRVRALGSFRPGAVLAIRLLRVFGWMSWVLAVTTWPQLTPLPVVFGGVHFVPDSVGFLLLAYVIHRGLPDVAAELVRRIVRERPEARKSLILAGLVRAEVPKYPPRTLAEWERNAWGPVGAPDRAQAIGFEPRPAIDGGRWRFSPSPVRRTPAARREPEADRS